MSELEFEDLVESIGFERAAEMLISITIQEAEELISFYKYKSEMQ